MERLQFIVREINKLLNETHNLLTFDALAPGHLLRVVGKVLHALNVEVKIDNRDPSKTAVAVLSALQSIKYAPVESVNVNDFCDGFASSNKNIIYPVLEWLLRNQTKIRKRAYLARYVDKITIPPEAADDPEVMQVYRNYERLIEEFWSAYKEDSYVRKESIQVSELQTDIKKMNQDMGNLNQRNQAQWGKLSSVPNKENLIYIGKAYRTCCLEAHSLGNQVKENVESVNNLEFQVKNLEDRWLSRGRYPLVDTNMLQMVQEELRVNKIFYETQLPKESEIERNLIVALEETIETVSGNRESLLKAVNKCKNEVQQLTSEKLNLYASTEDKLGPFRKQAGTIAQKKVELSDDVKEIKMDMAQIDQNIREKEISLFNVVGGKILHGEELKQFVAALREKSTVYKQLRGQLQSVSTEQGIESRTLDVLKTLDPTVENAYLSASVIPKEEHRSEYFVNISDAKQLCKQLMQVIESLKASITETQERLTSGRKETENINKTMDEVKDLFENATRGLSEDVRQLKERNRETQNNTDILEKTWKTTTQSLDKSEYIFNRLLDEMIDDTEGATLTKDSYLTMLTKKKEECQKLIQRTQDVIKMEEEAEQQEQEVLEFFKYVEYLVSQKIKEDEP